MTDSEFSVNSMHETIKAETDKRVSEDAAKELGLYWRILVKRFPMMPGKSLKVMVGKQCVTLILQRR